VVEDGSGIGVLVDPGVKDPVAADKRRIRALLSACDAVTDSDQIKSYLGSELFEQYRQDSKAGGDIVDQVDSLKKWLQKRAREYENESNTLLGSIAELGDVPDAIDTVPDVDGLRMQAADADQMLKSARAKREGQQEALRRLDECLDLPDVEGLQTQHGLIQSKVEQLTNELREAAELSRKLAMQIESAEHAHKQHANLKAQVSEIITDDAVTELAVASEQKTAEYENAVALRDRARTVDADRQRRRELDVKLSQAQQYGELCRKLASESHSLLHAAVSEHCPGWSIDEELRLCVEHSRGDQIPYGELSPGERAIRAVAVTIPHEYEGDAIPVVALPQEVYESLDAANRKMFVAYLAERGLAGVTAEASRRVDQEVIEAELFAVSAD
jgi:hypothetical protein